MRDRSGGVLHRVGGVRFRRDPLARPLGVADHEQATKCLRLRVESGCEKEPVILVFWKLTQQLAGKMIQKTITTKFISETCSPTQD